MKDIYLPEGNNVLEITMDEIPVIADLYITVRDAAGALLSGVTLLINGVPCTTGSSGACYYPGLTPGPHSGSCTKAGYEVTSVVLNGSPIAFSNGNF